MIRATYRLQFHKDFPFREAMAHARYFTDLGVSHIYSSPILCARAGSRHGYDVIDHSRVNPELGGEEDFRSMCAALASHGIGVILDIVPNHMAVGKADNRWWLDVLAKGRESRFAHYFDIDWDAPGMEGKILAPFLGAPALDAFAKGDLRLVRDESGWAFAYFDHRFPLRPQDQEGPHADPEALLARQHFLLTDWREADARINWRRFFDINDLAALNVNDQPVFEATHAKILALYAEGLIQGVRVDHIDGLADPAAYCRLLRQRLDGLRPGGLILVEKILADGESLPADWSVDGTTGYDFMNEVSAVLHARDGRLEDLWQRQSGRGLDFEGEEQVARRQMLLTKFASQRKAAARALKKVLGHDEETLDAAQIAVIERLRCYRTYANGKFDSPGAGPFLLKALDQSARDLPHLKPAIGAIQDLFARRDGDTCTIDAIRRFSQLSAPVAAKAVEDTAFYRYGRLLSRNDVGFDPRIPCISVADFHARMAERAGSLPRSFLATATHDHKRGEDTRARLAVLSRLPGVWEDFIATAPDPGNVDRADAYHLYQTLLGAWPEGAADEHFAGRILGWCTKYLREAKLRSDWTAPNGAYERAFRDFARMLILAPQHAPFRARLQDLLNRVSTQSEENALIQIVLRNTVPGIPDLYQGCEFQDLSLVDPDNRRAVNFSERAATLAAGNNGKQSLIARLLDLRRRDPLLWACGDYRPLLPEAENLLAFSRQHGTSRLLVLARLCTDPPYTEIHLECDYFDLLHEKWVAAGSVTTAALLDGAPILVLHASG
ncbi:MAG TPA: malto-oligosyltrehalose synthase [Rhizomicrobium sp.]|nr:malto-oligosyltrehalose synthase [Rhizomicrobium sp.]